MATLGAEVVQADLLDVVSLSKAFTDANAIFVNTDYWGPFIAAKRASMSQKTTRAKSDDEIAFQIEVLHGKNAAHAAAAVPSLERFVYSALPGIEKQSDGKYSCHHADSKSDIVDYIIEKEPVLAKKSSKDCSLLDIALLFPYCLFSRQ